MIKLISSTINHGQDFEGTKKVDKVKDMQSRNMLRIQVANETSELHRLEAVDRINQYS